MLYIAKSATVYNNKFCINLIKYIFLDFFFFEYVCHVFSGLMTFFFFFNIPFQFLINENETAANYYIYKL